MLRRLATPRHRLCRAIFRNIATRASSTGNEVDVRDLHIPLTDRTTEKRRKAVHLLVTNFPAPKLASALLEREVALARAAELLDQGRHSELKVFLESFQLPALPVAPSGMPQQKASTTDTPLKVEETTDATPTGGFPQKGGFPTPQRIDPQVRENLSRHLARLPREYVGLGRLLERRASVVLPLCHHNGVPSIVFTRRSSLLNKHPGDICFPGGMIDRNDMSAVGAALRELEEEVGVKQEGVDVLGVLRCDWSELTAVTGVAVTPVIGYIRDDVSNGIRINRDEVDAWFSVSLEDLANPAHWEREAYQTPVFSLDGKQIIWGLTAYILDRFMRKALRRTVPGFLTGVAPGILEHEVQRLVRSEINRQVHSNPLSGKLPLSEPDHSGRWRDYVRRNKK
jgi:nudix motif 8